MPYHPPQTDAFTNELRWFLVAVPDKPEYVRAGFGAYSEFTKYWLWDNQVGDANAAADSWDEAVNATLEALEMGFPDVLLGHIDEVESLLREIRDSGGGLNCCPEVPGADTLISDVPSNLETSDTDVGGGVFPGGMTAGEFDTYLCNAASAYVDMLIDLPDEALEQFQIGFALLVTLIVIFTTGAYIGIAGAIAGVVTVTTILNFIGVLEEIIDGITNGTEDNPSVPSQELTDAKDALVCAIYQANDADAAATALRTEIQSAVSSTGWENLLLLWPHETLLAKVFNGDAPDAPAANCPCEDPTPTGYHLEPRQPGSYGTANNTNITGTDWQADGTITIDFSNSSGSEWFVQAIMNTNYAQHGYELEIVDVTIPGASDVGIHFAGMAGSLVDLESRIGQVIRGYHTGNHSGAEWDSWVALADEVRNYAIVNNNWPFGEYPNQSAVTGGGFQLVFKVRFLFPD